MLWERCWRTCDALGMEVREEVGEYCKGEVASTRWGGGGRVIAVALDVEVTIATVVMKENF